jgi:hypothetical protein
MQDWFFLLFPFEGNAFNLFPLAFSLIPFDLAQGSAFNL